MLLIEPYNIYYIYILNIIAVILIMIFFFIKEPQRTLNRTTVEYLI
jgi:hypothetical protein